MLGSSSVVYSLRRDIGDCVDALLLLSFLLSSFLTFVTEEQHQKLWKEGMTMTNFLSSLLPFSFDGYGLKPSPLSSLSYSPPRLQPPLHMEFTSLIFVYHSDKIDGEKRNGFMIITENLTCILASTNNDTTTSQTL
jgi:hypothetical protein